MWNSTDWESSKSVRPQVNSKQPWVTLTQSTQTRCTDEEHKCMSNYGNVKKKGKEFRCYTSSCKTFLKCSNIFMAVETWAKTFLPCWSFHFTLSFILVILFDNILLSVSLINNSLTHTSTPDFFFFIFRFNLANEASQKQRCISTVTLVRQCDATPALWSRVWILPPVKLKRNQRHW